MIWKRCLAAASLALGLMSLAGPDALAGPPRGARDDAFAGKSALYRAASTGKARTFTTAAYVAGLSDALRDEGPFTLFVPTDEAFAKLPEGALLALLRPENEKKLAEILKYHVIKGRVLAAEITGNPRPRTLAGPALTIAANKHGVAVNDATVVEADLVGRNGVVHLIDRVLMPPDQDDVLSVASKSRDFQILVKAIGVAGLGEALGGDGPFTVLAPTNEAFAKLGEKAVNDLLKDKKKLAAVLKYHVIPGRLKARDLIAKGSATTLLDAKVQVDIKSGRLVVNQSNVVASDIEASNGIIHAIDAVLIPEHD